MVTVGASLLILAAGLTAPDAIIGTWASEGNPACASADLAFGASSAAVAASSCVYTGLRQQHATRWYVNLECADGAIRLLDINKLDESRLMIAERPLGEAFIYKRCG